MKFKQQKVPVDCKYCTEVIGSDRYAYHIISIDKDRRGAVITPYNAKYVGKAYGDERYEYEDKDGNPLIDNDPKRFIRVVYRYGYWRMFNHTGPKCYFLWGVRDQYRDPSF